MTKTQIQVPEELFAEIKQFAQRREWSLAETFRRGAELLLETYAEDTPPASQAWQPPSSRGVGCGASACAGRPCVSSSAEV